MGIRTYHVQSRREGFLKEVQTEIEINGPLEQVWRSFTDLSSYKDWNPFIKQAEGELRVGNDLKMFLQPPGGKGMEFHPKVITVIPNKEVSWRGRIPGLFTGEHKFTLEIVGGNITKFKQQSTFTGLATKFIGDDFVEGGRKGFEEMERALKERAEKQIQ